MLTHLPWDGGATQAALVEVFGRGVAQKTVKTLCGRRVKRGAVRVKGYTCALCRRAEVERAALAEEALEALHGREVGR